jgi:probable DNA metabolism protein
MPLRRVELQEGADLDGFRRAVRALIAADIAPQDVIWGTRASAMLPGEGVAADAPQISLPRAVSELIALDVCHRDPERHALLYALVWRIRHGEPALLAVHSDKLVHHLAMMRKAVLRDLHKMHAFLRFRRIEDADGGERYIAWFEPCHFIVEAVADFFVTRFRGMVWSILTPVGSLHWDGERLVIGPGAVKSDAPSSDEFEAGWLGYYESVFNPARVNPTAMRSEMAKKYWHNMPEAAAILEMVRSASARAQAMIERGASMPIKRNPDKAVAAMFERREG